MKFIVLAVLAFAAIAASAPLEKEPAKILESEFDQQPQGDYVYRYKSDDGISKQENGEVKELLDEDNKPRNVVTVRGSYSYGDENGVEHSVSYYADETGFHAESKDIPVAARR